MKLICGSLERFVLFQFNNHSYRQTPAGGLAIHSPLPSSSTQHFQRFPTILHFCAVEKKEKKQNDHLSLHCHFDISPSLPLLPPLPLSIWQCASTSSPLAFPWLAFCLLFFCAFCHFNTKLNLISLFCFVTLFRFFFYLSLFYFSLFISYCCLIEREIAVDWLFCMRFFSR